MNTLANEPALQWFAVALYSVVALAAASHALMNKRDPRSAWGWIAVCWLFPLAGALLYYLFGINRIHTRARRIVGPDFRHAAMEHPSPGTEGVHPGELKELIRIGAAMTRRPLSVGNNIEPLFDGDAAYPAMLQAIQQAQQSVHLASYIYRSDESGEEFAVALANAQQRGVKVRVLLDGVADVLYRPRASGLLQQHGVAAALFLPPRWWPPMLHVNLRNHRKLLIVDGDVGFTGGMNIDDQHCSQRKGTVRDVHFCLRGPIVNQLEEVFLDDWRLASGEKVENESAPPLQGSALARVITDGPNEQLDRLLMILLGALATAHERVWIMTPYLAPPSALLSALRSAALRGVDVCLLLPQRSDQAWMDGAARHLLWQLLQSEVRVFWSPPPFTHTKLLIVDDFYTQIGSANMDARSLRLNFEAVVEFFDRDLNATLAGHFENERQQAQPATLADLAARPLPARLRDAFYWLFTPYL